MEIFGGTTKLTKILAKPELIKKNYGKLTQKIMARLDEFAAARTLRDIPSTPPPRRHALKGERRGQFAVTVSGNYRLVFEGYDKNDQLSVDIDKITTISIISIEDYHKN